jgi:phage terminase large subunit-like protein
VDLVWLDEEHDEDVYKEGRARTVDRMGRVVMTMTPLKGMTWVHARFVENRQKDEAVAQLSILDNPHLSPEEVESFLKEYGPHERAARERGEFTAIEGRVYEFHRQLHTVPAFEPPAEWPRFRGIDFGTRNPFCCLWFAWDQRDDVLHVYRQHYRSGWTTKQHGDWINEVSKGEPMPEFTVADPENLDARITLANECELETLPALKMVREGINAVAERLRPDAEGRPHLVVHVDNPETGRAGCPDVVREFENYVWDERQGGKTDQPDKPLKRDDHAMDVVKYVCLLHTRWYGTGVTEEAAK